MKVCHPCMFKLGMMLYGSLRYEACPNNLTPIENYIPILSPHLQFSFLQLVHLFFSKNVQKIPDIQDFSSDLNGFEEKFANPKVGQ